jgi:hypothetical protein
MTTRPLKVFALCLVAVVAFAACSSDDAPSSSSTTTTSKAKAKDKTSTTTAPKPSIASTWVQQWQPTLIGVYGAAQGEFLRAVATRQPETIRAAAPKLLAANATLRDAITKAGAPPEADAASTTLTMSALEKEAQILQTIQTVCTPPLEACTNALSEYAKNQQELIVLFTDLGAAS